jgi:hypothetical protein
MDSVEILNALAIIRNNLDSTMIGELRTIIKDYTRYQKNIKRIGKLSNVNKSSPSLIVDFN